MKFLWLILIILLSVYLNRTYAYYYDYIGDHYQKAPAQTILRGEDIKPGFVLLGDSLMAGVGVSAEGENLGLLLYKVKGETKNLEYFNLAFAGATAENVLKQQLPEALKAQPREVTLLVGINDAHDFTADKDFEQNYRQIVDGLIASSAQITLINIPYLGSSSILLPPWSLFMEIRTRQLNSIIDKIAKENNLKLVDLYKLSRERFVNPSELYSEDQFHPSDEGYALWSDYINAN